MTHEEQIAQAQYAFDTLYRHVTESKFSYVCTIDGKKFGKPYPFDISTAENRLAMAQKAIEINDLGHNVYFSVNLQDTPPTGYNRGDSSKITMQTAIICDIDFAGGSHKTGAKKKLAADYYQAKSWLPFETSLNVFSGGGMHGYNILAEPVKITDANRSDILARNKLFIDVVRNKAGKDYQIDGVGDLARVLRVPGTKNFKSTDAPTSYILSASDLTFTLADFDAKLDAAFLTHEEEELKPIVKKLSEDYKKAARTAYDDDIFNSADYNIFRAKRMLDALKNVNHKDLDYGRWLAINTACKNIGVPYDVVDAFNRSPNNGDNYNAEQNLKRWQQLNAPSFDIATLHGIARDLADYSEKDSRIAYRKLYPDKFKQAAGTDLFSDNEYKLYFGGDCSDLDNAIRMEKFFGVDFRYKMPTDDDTAEFWLDWRNGRWHKCTDKPTVLLPATQKLYAVLNKNAVDADAAKIANSFKQSAKVFSAISFLRARDSIRITADDLDSHKNLLNCLNGVVDLQTGDLYAHGNFTRNLLLTQQVNAVYDAKAQSDLVTNFFRDIMPDEQTRAALLRLLGYAITASCEEEKFVVMHGAGSNGKGVLGATLLELLGSYATGINQRALIRNSPFAANASTASTELNCLEKRRFALSEELPQKCELNVELIKNLTAGDKVPIRRLYQEERTITNYCKIFLSGNFQPELVNVADYGLKRRLINLPFTVQFGVGGKPIDYDLKRKMRTPENLSALLALLVREAVSWYREHSKGKTGLIISAEMQNATAQYLDSNNFVAEFIDTGEKFIRSPGASVKAKDFIDALKAEYPAECANFKKQDLIRHIQSVGGVEYTVDNHNSRVFKGIGKLADSDFDGEPLAPDDTPPPVD